MDVTTHLDKLLNHEVHLEEASHVERREPKFVLFIFVETSFNQKPEQSNIVTLHCFEKIEVWIFFEDLDLLPPPTLDLIRRQVLLRRLKFG